MFSRSRFKAHKALHLLSSHFIHHFSGHCPHNNIHPHHFKIQGGKF